MFKKTIILTGKQYEYLLKAIHDLPVDTAEYPVPHCIDCYAESEGYEHSVEHKKGCEVEKLLNLIKHNARDSAS